MDSSLFHKINMGAGSSVSWPKTLPMGIVNSYGNNMGKACQMWRPTNILPLLNLLKLSLVSGLIYIVYFIEIITRINHLFATLSLQNVITALINFNILYRYILNCLRHAYEKINIICE